MVPPTTESSEKTIVQDMSQIILKELELTILKNQNNNLENLALKREKERKAWEAKCEELQNKMVIL